MEGRNRPAWGFPLNLAPSSWAFIMMTSSGTARSNLASLARLHFEMPRGCGIIPTCLLDLKWAAHTSSNTPMYIYIYTCALDLKCTTNTYFWYPGDCKHVFAHL